MSTVLKKLLDKMDRAVDDSDRAMMNINDVAESMAAARARGDHGREATLQQELEDARRAKANAAARVTATAQEITVEVARDQQA